MVRKVFILLWRPHFTAHMTQSIHCQCSDNIDHPLKGSTCETFAKTLAFIWMLHDKHIKHLYVYLLNRSNTWRSRLATHGTHHHCPGARHHRIQPEVLCPCLNRSEPSPIHSGASIDRTCSSSSNGCLIRLGSGELRSQVDTLLTLLWPLLSSFCAVPGHIVLLGRSLPSESVVAMKGCPRPAMVISG